MNDKIKAAKERLGDRLLILAHHYQSDEIVAAADAVGDSLKLAQIAAANKTAELIVFCGVHFMAETADILTEDRQMVFMPDRRAGCPMADMADMKSAQHAWDKLTEIFGESIVPITYINSKAEIKAFCGAHGGTTVTSGNAASVIKWGFDRADKILFLPDQNLGRNTAYDLGIGLDQMALYHRETGEVEFEGSPENIKMILWDGYCPIHHRISLEHIQTARKNHPDAKIFVHPECPFEVAEAADGKGSTEYLIKATAEGSDFVIGTEQHLVNRLINTNSDKNIAMLDDTACCEDMGLTNEDSLLRLLEALERGDYSSRITVDKSIAADAVKALDVMLSL